MCPRDYFASDQSLPNDAAGTPNVQLLTIPDCSRQILTDHHKSRHFQRDLFDQIWPPRNGSLPQGVPQRGWGWPPQPGKSLWLSWEREGEKDISSKWCFVLLEQLGWGGGWGGVAQVGTFPCRNHWGKPTNSMFPKILAELLKATKNIIGYAILLLNPKKMQMNLRCECLKIITLGLLALFSCYWQTGLDCKASSLV